LAHCSVAAASVDAVGLEMNDRVSEELNPMPTPLSVDEAKELIRLCKDGRLYEVEAWIHGGRSLVVPLEVRTTPLKVAIETGFHSLIDLLLRHEESQQAKDDALDFALLMDRPAFTELALVAGADAKSVPFLSVLLTGNRSIVTTFLEHGADPVADYPFARAFCELRAKTTLGSFLDCKRMRPDLEPRLQEQADMALRQFSQDGNLKWVSLMLWVGANPRTRGPVVDDIERIDDPDSHTTALDEACGSGNVKLLKQLKPQSSDNLTSMLSRAAFAAHRDVLAYLLELGANPNDKPDGGSSALESCIRYLGWEDFGRVRYGNGQAYETPGPKVSKGREAIKLLLQHGAIWKPDLSTLRATRRILYRTEPEVTLELIGQLLKVANGENGARELLRVTRMQQHLASCKRQLAALGLTHLGRRTQKSEATVDAEPTPREPARYDRDHLYEELWSVPATEICRSYGISEARLSSLCRLLEIPTPPHGYWATPATGRAQTPRPPLLPLGFRRARI
jgi:ankyrin repeat protein